MAKKYLHLGFNWEGPTRTDAVQKLIEVPGNVDDWMKYGGNCWIICTPHDATAWSNYLKQELGPNDHLIILEITNLGDANGWLPEKMWEWFKRLRF